ncbi:MAG: septum formation initiator family protein [Candidatus Magasanikbacteria bacterium]|jgi:cell division protein FtsB|nr:septum formation initiator family protein [Candidatus Magasanikbacteria bacterium]
MSPHSRSVGRNKEHPFRRFFASRLFLVVCLVVIALVAVSYARAYYQDYTVRKEIAALQEEIQQLQKKRLDSLSLLEYVQDDAFVEEKARVELHMKKPGEQVLFLDTSTLPQEVVSTTPKTVGGQVLSNPVKWWYYFTHRPLPTEDA